jgi:predicted DNA-binding WGR domain protein
LFEFEFEARESEAVSCVSATTDVNFTSNFISNSNSSPNPSVSEVSSSQVGAVARASSGWPVGVPMPVGYSVYDFEKFRPEANLSREYQVSYQPSLWEGYCTYRMWGRRGKTKQWRSNSFASEVESLGWVRSMVLRRLKKGYQLTGWSVQFC